MNAAGCHPRVPALLRAALAGSVMAGCAPAAPPQGEGGHAAASALEIVQAAASMQDRIGAVLDPSLEFTDERGYPFKLQQLFPGERPVVLVPGYYGCPDMCGQVMTGMLEALNEIDLTPGKDYQVVNVSIDPRETAEVAMQRKQKFLPKLTRVGGDEGWRFLVGQEPAIKALTGSVGFNYLWSEHTNRFDHPGALLFVSKQGRLSRVITGTTFVPGDVRLAIIEASEGKLGGFWDKLRLSCLTWDARTNTYSVMAVTVMRIGGVLTVAALAVMIVVMVRREKRRPAHSPTAPPASPASA